MGSGYRVDLSAQGKAKTVDEAYERKTKNHPDAWRMAIIGQQKGRPDDFPINNRAARRRAAKGKAVGEH